MWICAKQQQQEKHLVLINQAHHPIQLREQGETFVPLPPPLLPLISRSSIILTQGPLVKSIGSPSLLATVLSCQPLSPAGECAAPEFL